MLRSSLFVALIAFSASGFAQELNYNYLQVSYGQVEFDDTLFDVDGDGFGLNGVFAINEDFHLFGDYQTSGLDFGVDLNILEAGFGYNRSMSEMTDLVARVGYVRVEADAPGVPSQDDTGFSLGAGVRSAISDALELNGGIDYIDVDDDSETRIRAGFNYSFSDEFSAGFDATWWEDVSVYRFSARWDF